MSTCKDWAAKLGEKVGSAIKKSRKARKVVKLNVIVQNQDQRCYGEPVVYWELAEPTLRSSHPNVELSNITSPA